MKLGFDARVLAYNQEGIGNYVRGLLLGLSQLKIVELEEYQVKWDLFIYINEDLSKKDSQLINSLNPDFFNVTTVKIKPTKGFAAEYRQVFKIIGEARKLNLDFIFTTHSQILPLFYKNTIWHLHDLLTITHPGMFEQKFSGLKRFVFNQVFALSLKRAKYLTTSATANKDTLLEVYPNLKTPISPIGGGNWLNVKEITNLAGKNKKPDMEDKFFLNVNTLSPRKNIPFLLEAFVNFSKNPKKEGKGYKLIIVGKRGWGTEAIDEKMRQLKSQNPELDLEHRIIFKGFVEESELKELMTNCVAFIYPSIAEGFGIPPLEALNYGRNIILSDIPVFKEIYCEVGNFFDISDIGSLERVMKKIVMGEITSPDPDIIKKLLKKYSWKQTSLNLVDAINAATKIK